MVAQCDIEHHTSVLELWQRCTLHVVCQPAHHSADAVFDVVGWLPYHAFARVLVLRSNCSHEVVCDAIMCMQCSSVGNVLKCVETSKCMHTTGARYSGMGARCSRPLSQVSLERSPFSRFVAAVHTCSYRVSQQHVLVNW